MGTIASDFYARFGSIEIVEAPFEAGELVRMASLEVQEQYAEWVAQNEESGYVPGDLLLSLIDDRTFFAELLRNLDDGESVVFSGVVQAYTTEHIQHMGLTSEAARENVRQFFENEMDLTDSIEGVLSGTEEWVNCLYVFANGWVGVETVRMRDIDLEEFTEEEREDFFDAGPEPASSYLLDEEGELIATPDLRYDVEAWMDFVDTFSAIHEEAAAADRKRKSTKSTYKESGEVVPAGKGFDRINIFGEVVESAESSGRIVMSREVESAIQEGKPIVAIESEATFGGMIYPGIADFAFRMRQTIRDHGAVPAFIAILGGQIHVGLEEEEILYLDERRGLIPKASARDIPVLMAMHSDGVMTIAAVLQIASIVGIPFACGSGIGGAQIGAEKTMDISTDLEALARNQIMVVCSGTKPIQDLNLTMEYLETAGVPVIGYGTNRMPEYMVRGSGFRLYYHMDTPEEIADIMRIKKELTIPGGVLVVNPVPKEYELDPVKTKEAVDTALEDVRRNKVMGKAVTVYMMGRIKELLGPQSVESQKAFLLNNGALAADLARAYVEVTERAEQ